MRLPGAEKKKLPGQRLETKRDSGLELVKRKREFGDERDCCLDIRIGPGLQRAALCAAGAGGVAQEERRGYLADHVWRLQRAPGYRDCARAVSARSLVDSRHGREPAHLRFGDALDVLLSGQTAAGLMVNTEDS